MADVTIYHNPGCGTSRNVLAMIRAAGIEPRVVLYLQTPPDRRQLLALIAATGQPARALLRQKGDLYRELGFDDPSRTDEEIVAAMLVHPVLIERPIVVTPRGTRLCRPAESVLELLSPADGAGAADPGSGALA